MRVARGWRVAATPLTDWRDDDEDALLRCSLDSEHVIRNGDRYAVAGIKMACLPCAGIAPPPAPVEAVKPAARPRPTGPSAIDRQFGGMSQPKALAPSRVRKQARPTARPATAEKRSSEPPPSPGRAEVGHPAVAAPAPEPPTGLMDGSELIGDWPTPPSAVPAPLLSRPGTPMLGPAPRDDGRAVEMGRAPRKARPRREAWSEQRTCERTGCEATFTVTSASKHKRLCSNPCVIAVAQAARSTQPRKADAVTVTVVAPALCTTCGAEFRPVPTRPWHCSWQCVRLAPVDHSAGCGCYACGERRRDAGADPLFGLAVGTDSYEERIEEARRRPACVG